MLFTLNLLAKKMTFMNIGFGNDFGNDALRYTGIVILCTWNKMTTARHLGMSLAFSESP